MSCCVYFSLVKCHIFNDVIIVLCLQDSSIYIFDHIATVSVDDCINCNIFLGPIRSRLVIFFFNFVPFSF